MRLLLALLLLVSFVVGNASPLAQSPPYVIPYTRNDSIRIGKHDSLSDVFLERGELNEAARHLDAAAMLCWQHNDLLRAKLYYERSLHLNRMLSNHNAIAGINSNLAFIYSDLQRYDSAYLLLEQTLTVRRAEKKRIGIISTLVNESVVLNHMKRYKTSVERLEEALTLAREDNDERQMRSIYGMLSETYQKAGNAQKALYYYEYYRTFNDYVTTQRVASMRQELAQQRLEKENMRLRAVNDSLTNARLVATLGSQADSLAQASARQSVLQDSLSESRYHQARLDTAYTQASTAREEAEVASARSRRVAGLAIGAGSIILLLLALAIWLLRGRARDNRALRERQAEIESQSLRLHQVNAELQHANASLGQRNAEMTASITYSRGVQEAVMQHGEALEDLFPASFMISRPLQIVSGDFHYVRKMPDGRTIVVVADCVGHGVSGAFLTILGVVTLDRSIFDHRFTTIPDIITDLDEAFAQLNRGSTTLSNSLDLCVVIVGGEGRSIEFAGVRNGIMMLDGEGLRVVRGSALALGQVRDEASPLSQSLQVHRFEFIQPTWCYLFTDGLLDQMNGANERFSKARLRALIEGLPRDTPQSQLAAITAALDKWQGRARQTDDMLLLAFRLG